MTTPTYDTTASGYLPPSVGERNSAAKLTALQVQMIRGAADSGGTIAGLAEAFGVSPRAVRHIVNRTSWTHIPEAGE